MFERKDKQDMITDWICVKEKVKKNIECITGVGECERERGRKRKEGRGGGRKERWLEDNE